MRFARPALAIAVAAGLVTVLPPAAQETFAQRAPAGGVAKAALNRRLPDVKLLNVGLADAIDFVRDVSGANVVVNWRALADAGVTRDTPVNVRLNAVTLRKVLTTVLSEAGAGTALAFTLDDDVIEVTTQQIADARLYMKIYPIEDLIMEVPNFDNAPDFNLQSSSGGGGGGGGGGGNSGGGGGGGGGLFGGGNAGGGKQDEKQKTREERAQEIVDLITSTVRPDVWRDAGGTASIRYFNGSLIVSAPLSVHELIGG